VFSLLPSSSLYSHSLPSIAVTTLNRPAAAPQTGDFDLGYYAIAHPTFIAGMSASATIFISSSGSSAFLPVIAEMKNPRDYKKALLMCMSLVNASYLTFRLVVYKWCGQWVASPSLGVSLISSSSPSPPHYKNFKKSFSVPIILTKIQCQSAGQKIKMIC